ncbi:MAG TPA: efflux transporter periplasmic adaptor subunit, partial [Segetibacter sp.]
TAKQENKENSEENSPRPLNDDDIEEVVFVLQPDKITVKKVRVRTNIQDINYIEILGGLKVGDEVITGPYNVVSKTLKDGDKVKVVPKDQVFETKS